MPLSMSWTFLGPIGDFLRAPARPIREDDHLVVTEIGNGVDGRPEHGPQSPTRDADPQRDNQKTITERKFNQMVDHDRHLRESGETPQLPANCDTANHENVVNTNAIPLLQAGTLPLKTLMGSY